MFAFMPPLSFLRAKYMAKDSFTSVTPRAKSTPPPTGHIEYKFQEKILCAHLIFILVIFSEEINEQIITKY